MKTISMAALGALVVVAACADTDPLGPDLASEARFVTMSSGETSRLVVELSTSFGFCTIGDDVVISGEVTVENVEAGSSPGATQGLSVRVDLTGKNPPAITNFVLVETSGNLATSQLALEEVKTYQFTIQFDPAPYTQFKVFAYGDVANRQGGGWPMQSPSDDFVLPTEIPECNGAVIERRGIGYWKNHEAETTEELPVTIGDVVVATFAAANAILDMATGPSWNGIEKLMAQLLAAELNGSIGACGFSEIAATVTAAQAFLDGKASDPATAWSLLTEAQKDGAEELKDQLDEWNNGSCS
jgi:hypothetical protein